MMQSRSMTVLLSFCCFTIVAYSLQCYSGKNSIDLKLSMRSKLNPPMMSSSDNSAISFDISLRSPCKLNLFLRILGRRESGFHDLASLFQAITLSDTMFFRKLDGKEGNRDILSCSDKTLVLDDSNLVIKALNLMREKTGIDAYFSVHLDKNIPMQAGLGGGSGNAATTMHAFNALCGYPASNDDLKRWSGDIGSDITFFFSSGTAYCTGRGEIVQPLPPLPHWESTRVHIFKPKEGLSTGMVFKNLDLDYCMTQGAPDNLLELWSGSAPIDAASGGGLINDLEAPAFQCSPALRKLKKDIMAEGIFDDAVMMSGSGTSIYALSNYVESNAASEATISQTVESILKAHPGTQYFDCRFLTKPDDVSIWYE